MSLAPRATIVVSRFAQAAGCQHLHIRAASQLASRKPSPTCLLHRSPRTSLQVLYRTFASKASPKKKPPQPRRAETPPRNHAVVRSSPQSYVAPRDAYAKTLASRTSSTLLYSNIGNPEFASFLAAMVGGYCVLYGCSWVYESAFVSHPGLWWPVNAMNGFVGVFMVGLGVSVFSRTRGQIGSIRAIPIRNHQGHGLMLRVESRNSLSFPLFWKRPVQWAHIWPPAIQECSIPDIKLLQRIGEVRDVKSTLSGADIQRRKEQLLAQDRSGFTFFIDPIRRVFASFKSWAIKIVVGHGYVNVTVKDKKFRMDVNSGWLLDEGQALERLLNAR